MYPVFGLDRAKINYSVVRRRPIEGLEDPVHEKKICFPRIYRRRAIHNSTRSFFVLSDVGIQGCKSSRLPQGVEFNQAVKVGRFTYQKRPDESAGVSAGSSLRLKSPCSG